MFFSAVIHFKANHTMPERTGSVEERVIILMASSLDEATAKAHDYALSEEVEYKGEDDDFISWKFERLLCVREVVDPIGSAPCEIFSRHLSSSEALSISLPFMDTE